ncbi:MAG: aminopeptidase P family protein [Acidobacteria bacterium]|nr:aminopeptidase P family protein [Acidobacteriota bacterium]
MKQDQMKKMKRGMSRRAFLETSSMLGGTLCTISAGALSVPVEAMWLGPPLPVKDPPEIPASVFKRRLTAVQAELAKRDVGALVLFSVQGYDTRYLAQHAPGILLVPTDGAPTLFATGRPQTWLSDIRSGRDYEPMLDQCAERLKKLRLERGKIAVGGEFDWAVKTKLRAALPDARLEAGIEIQDQLRLIKDEYELAFLRRAQEISDAQIRAGQMAIRPGRRDWDVLADLVHVGVMHGAAIDTCRHFIGYGPGTDDLWAPPTGRSIQAGEVVNFEGIVYYGYYNIETPITFSVGKVSAKQKDLANVNFEAFQAGLAAMKPGAPVAEVVDATNKVLKANGFEKMIRRHGHFIGLANNDRPSFDDAIKAGLVLQAGMTISYHTTITVPSKEAIVVVGRVVVVTSNGRELLSKIELTPMVEVAS